MFFNKVLVALVPQLVTAVCFRSFIAADDTTAVPGLIPDVHGAPLRQTMTKINCTDGVLDEEVGHNNDQTCPMPFEPKPKPSLSTNAISVLSQSEFEEELCNQRQTRENARKLIQRNSFPIG